MLGKKKSTSGLEQSMCHGYSLQLIEKWCVNARRDVGIEGETIQMVSWFAERDSALGTFSYEEYV
jgi:hypothetical protein